VLVSVCYSILEHAEVLVSVFLFYFFFMCNLYISLIFGKKDIDIFSSLSAFWFSFSVVDVRRRQFRIKRQWVIWSDVVTVRRLLRYDFCWGF